MRSGVAEAVLEFAMVINGDSLRNKELAKDLWTDDETC